jgi:predicted ester cyclase
VTATRGTPRAGLSSERPRLLETADENKRVVRRLMEELFSAGRIEVADELIAEGYVEHAPLPGQEPGLRGLKRALPRFWAAFPDFRLSIDDIIAEGDRVVVRSTATATHRGAFCGVPPTGLRVRWTAIDIIRLADGKQVEHWGNQETLEVLHQLNHLGVHAVDRTDTPAPAGASRSHNGDSAAPRAGRRDRTPA